MVLGDRRLIEARYYNANYYAAAIVASITEGIDWAAYIGGADCSISKEEAVKFVANYGCKLFEADARYFFKDINLPYRF